MEDLIAAKDDEITKLTKLKDTLRDQLMKAKTEINTLKEENEQLKEASESQGTTTYPDLEKKIKQLEDKVKTLTEENKKLLETPKKTSAKASKKGSAAKAKEEAESANAEGEEEQELTVDQLLKQVKTGMFKLGQQNFSIEQKIDSLVEILNKDGSAPQKEPEVSMDSMGPSNFGKAGIKSGGINQGATGSFRKPSEMKKMQEPEPKLEESQDQAAGGIVSQRLRGMRKGSPEPEAKPAPSSSDSGPVNPRMKAPEVGRKPMRSVEEEQYQPEAAPQFKEPKPDSSFRSSPSDEKAIKTIPYPSDGVIKCPNCKAINFQEMENKAKIISFTPVKKYGKKYYCKSCRASWDYQM